VPIIAPFSDQAGPTHHWQQYLSLLPLLLLLLLLLPIDDCPVTNSHQLSPTRGCSCWWMWAAVPSWPGLQLLELVLNLSCGRSTSSWRPCGDTDNHCTASSLRLGSTAHYFECLLLHWGSFLGVLDWFWTYKLSGHVHCIEWWPLRTAHWACFRH